MNPAARELHACVSRARALLQSRPLSDESVHEARKALKRARAVLRLLRPGMAKSVYREENAALRDAGRALSPLRDAKSQLDALAQLPRRFQKIGAGLRAEQARARSELERGAKGLRECLRLLAESEGRARSASLRTVQPRVLETGLQRLYRQGRKALRQAEKAGTPEALHEWRKQVKYLYNALDAMDGAVRSGASKAARRADRVANQLGEDHDLALLSKRELPERKARKLIDSRRSKLQKRAFALGEKLYGPKPKRFVKDLA